MEFFKSVFKFIIESSLWVALSVTSLTYVTFIELSLQPSYVVLLLVFSSTVFGYNFVKFFEESQLKSLSFSSFKNQYKALTKMLKINLWFSVVCLVLSLYCFFFLNKKSQLFLFLPAVFTYYYTNPLNNKTLRTISGLKIFIISICWVLIVVGLPVIEFDVTVTADIYIKWVQLFLFVIAITLPFEIRDLRTDPDSLNTIPQKMGIKKTKLLGVVLLMFFLWLEFFKDGIIEQNLLVLPIVFILSLLGLTLSKENQSKYYASFWVEGIPIFWLVLLLLT